ncbi:hypothetical protein LP52_21225 [Streptomonospora alba]|uniref:Aminoglycoside phosphotransferase domain-containing protein n=1 Tax=Streptomonospora alba TaxID=183763 RepID=A0A0C2J6P8_9ACTN|nr:phosphotransferase [Streptomonospora alba]KIH97096.1 hypothetical protein LP52_21225 [Streptomonospora alba]
MSFHALDASAVLTAAARAAGINADGAELIRDGANVLYRLPDRVVARVGRPGICVVAEREVDVSRWLEGCAVPVVHALAGVPQPVVIGGRPVTWWRLLPPHRPATPGELGAVLGTIHSLPIPEELRLPRFDPFAGIDPDHISTAQALDPQDRAWLTRRLADLREQYQGLGAVGSCSVIHGDAWQGNVAVPDNGTPIVMDLEKVALGPRDADLVSLAVDYTDFARIADEDYNAFVTAYGGYDVTTAPGFRTLAEIQELRWVCFTLSKAESRPGAAEEARHRIRCLRGHVPRPWTWNAF